MQVTFMRNSATLVNGGLLEAERIGEPCTECAQPTDRVYDDQMHAWDRFVELTQALPAPPAEAPIGHLQVPRAVLGFPACMAAGARHAPTRSTERDHARREEKAA